MQPYKAGSHICEHSEIQDQERSGRLTLYPAPWTCLPRLPSHAAFPRMRSRGFGEGKKHGIGVKYLLHMRC